MRILTTAFLRKMVMDVSGYYIYKIKDLPIGTDIWIDLKHKINIPLKTVFDVGANVGSFSGEILKNNPDANISAFEPVKSTYDKLVNNKGDFSNMSFHQIAMGNTEEKVFINIYDEKNSVLNSLNPHAMSKESEKREEIEVQRGDDFCSRNNIGHINLLKIDTEGFELNVLLGFTNMLNSKSIDLIYLETGFDLKNTRNTYFSNILDVLTKQGYQLFGLYEVSNWSISIGENYGNALFIRSDITKKWGFVKR
ncbi:FkbM family methyltransferase [Rhodonellum sp.]|uniref:FkbM family methyltransferase n=1 Tax=Rhodonellum sp. TaxID=2231180 RepID=UPI00272632FE|nr:FkbM family methyltransferase [Rhodonellum sp.]MDO9551470.1 FkbM family methyltransferase [Rhodonellum sp.]